MPEIFINGQPVQAADDETVLQAALRNGYFIPYFCWHKSLSIHGNCRICGVQPEGKNWVEIACNMPVAEGTCMVRLLQVMLRFYHHESCGQCTPCREGMGWLHRTIDRIVAGKGRPEDIDTLVRISEANDGTTICGMGDAAGYATVGIIAKYRDEFEYYIANGRSKNGGRLEVDAMEREVAHA